MEDLRENIEHLNQTHLKGLDASFQQELMNSCQGMSRNDMSCSNLNISENNNIVQEIENSTYDINLSNSSITPRNRNNSNEVIDFAVRVSQADLNGMENEKMRLRNTVNQLAEENKGLLLVQESHQRQLDDANFKIQNYKNEKEDLKLRVSRADTLMDDYLNS